MTPQVWPNDEQFVRDLSKGLVQPLLNNPATVDAEGSQRNNNVVGFGIGYKQTGGMTTDQLSVIVFVRTKLPEDAFETARDQLVRRQLNVTPDTVQAIDRNAVYGNHAENLGISQGILTDVQAIGTPRFDAGIPGTYTGTARPVVGGISVGWRNDRTGTLGCFVRDRKSGKICLLTAAHVLGSFNQAASGDVVIQPGNMDGGDVLFIDPTGKKPQDYYHVAIFTRTAPVQLLAAPTTPNRVDAAIAQLIWQDDYRSRIECDVGTPTAEGKPEIGMLVHKTGRTSGHSIGKILNTVSVFGLAIGGQTVPFEDLICTTVMSKEGYSGPRKLDHRLSYTDGPGKGKPWQVSGSSTRQRSRRKWLWLPSRETRRSTNWRATMGFTRR
jgi:hypothetical protein